VPLAQEAEQAPVQARELSEAESQALRGDFHLARGRRQLARPLLERAVELAPDLAAAHASLGRLALRDGNQPEARRRIGRAVELQSDSFFIHYLHALLNMGDGERTKDDLAIVEQSLRRSVALNHDFAPAYALLADVSGYRSGDYAAALALARRAVKLEPAVVRHRLVVGRLLTASGELDQAAAEGKRALAVARSDEDRQRAQEFLDMVSKRAAAEAAHAAAMSRALADGERIDAPQPAAAQDPVVERERVTEQTKERVRRPLEAAAKGVLSGMQCLPNGALLFAVQTASGRLILRADGPDRFLVRRAGQMVQLDWKCGQLRMPVTVRYMPKVSGNGDARVDGVVSSFDLEPAP
jgi:tetratricopeptide (TPR) repeat protein